MAAQITKDSPAQAVTLTPNTAMATGPASTNGVVAQQAWYRFGGHTTAQGYALAGTARGAIVMSNIFLVAAIIWLAADQAGCISEDREEIVEDCQGKVYGFSPASFVSNLSVFSGVLSALFMPILGAVVDATPYRWRVGWISAVMMMMIQATQIYTTADTWFVMALLQALAGFLYQVQVLAVFAYIPEIARVVGEETMTSFSSVFTATQFASQACFLLTVIVVSVVMGWGDVGMGQFSQGLNTMWSGLAFSVAWRLLPTVPPARELPDKTSLCSAGFKQTFSTARKIHKTFQASLQPFFLATIFAEAGINAFTILSVVFLSDHVGMSSQEIGVFFLLSLLFTLPGCKLGAMVTQRTNPRQSWQLCLLSLIVVTSGGALVVDALPSAVSYVWGGCIGLLVGWFYPTENLYFGLIVPREQEAELSGFFVYCSQILGWLPPLIFSVMIEADVSQTYGVMMLSIFFVAAIGSLSLSSASWEETVLETGASLEGNQNDMESEGASNKPTSTDGMDN